MNTTARAGPSIKVRVCACVRALGVTLATLVLVDCLAAGTAPTARGSWAPRRRGRHEASCRNPSGRDRRHRRLHGFLICFTQDTTTITPETLARPFPTETVMAFDAFDQRALRRFGGIGAPFEARVFGVNVLDWPGFPDGKHVLDFVIAESDSVATIGCYRGRHTRPFMGAAAPTDKSTSRSCTSTGCKTVASSSTEASATSTPSGANPASSGHRQPESRSQPVDRKSTRLNSSHGGISRMPSSA